MSKQAGNAARIASATPRKLVVSYDEDIGTPLLDGLIALAGYWKAIMGTAVVGALFGLALCFLLPRQYVVSSQYVFAADTPMGGGMAGIQARLGGLASLAGLDLSNPGSPRAEIVTTLRSEPFIQAFIRDEDLLPRLFASEWDPATKSWKVQGDEVPTLGDGYQRFMRTVFSLSEDKASGVVRMDLRWQHPEQAVQWSNSLVARLNASMKHQAIERAAASLQYLDKELQSTGSMELRQALYGLIESEAQKKLLASVTNEYALRAIAAPVVPDADKFESPRKPNFMLAGGFLGLIAAVAVVSIRLLLLRRR